MNAILTVEGLEAGYGDVRVVKGISFAVEDGAIATIICAFCAAGVYACVRKFVRQMCWRSPIRGAKRS